MSRTGSGIAEHGKPHRLMAVWTAAHDNGWVTSVVENPDGSFAAWAAPDGEGAGVYTIQPDVASAARPRPRPRCSATRDTTVARTDARSGRFAPTRCSIAGKKVESRATVRAAVAARRTASKRGAAA